MIARIAFYFVCTLSGLLIVINLLSFIGDEPSDWLSLLDFPKLQFFWAGCFLIALLAFLKLPDAAFVRIAVLVGLAATTVGQGLTLKNYTPLVEYAVGAYSGEPVAATSFRLMVANVHMKNEQFDRFLELVGEVQPDLLLVMETNKEWMNHLTPLSRRYRYNREIPLDNTYGMALYSSMELQNLEVKYLVHEDVPSIHATVVLPNAKKFRFHGTHPVPPVPSPRPDSFGEKEKELLIIGRLAARDSLPAIVAGDFNDVAWSSLTRLFADRAHLDDVRVGRGFYNTFSAKSTLMRWPLDHVFVTDDFEVIGLRRSPFFGSDHYAFIADLYME